MLIFLNAIISISLLKGNTNNYKLKYINFYINLLKRVKINYNKRYNKCNFKSLKVFISYNYYFKRISFLAPFYTL
jgi:hypothetical protein